MSESGFKTDFLDGGLNVTQKCIVVSQTVQASGSWFQRVTEAVGCDVLQDRGVQIL